MPERRRGGEGPAKPAVTTSSPAKGELELYVSQCFRHSSLRVIMSLSRNGLSGYMVGTKKTHQS